MSTIEELRALEAEMGGDLKGAPSERKLPERDEYGSNNMICKVFKDPTRPGKSGVRRPLHIPLYELLREAALISKSRPWHCRGYEVHHKKRAGKHLCKQELLCAVCNDRFGHLQAQRAAQRHLHGTPVCKLSMTIPMWRTDKDQALKAYGAFNRALRDLGWEHRTIWLHVHGEKPWEGPKAHFDGIISGNGKWPVGTALGVRHGIARGEILDALDGAWGANHLPVIHTRLHDFTNRNRKRLWKTMQSFIKGAKYAGRPTVPVRALIAGAMDPRMERFRLTNVNGKNFNQPTKIQDRTNPESVDGTFSIDDVYRWIEKERTWRIHFGRGGFTQTVDPDTELARRFAVLVQPRYWELRDLGWGR